MLVLRCRPGLKPGLRLLMEDPPDEHNEEYPNKAGSGQR